MTDGAGPVCLRPAAAMVTGGIWSAVLATVCIVAGVVNGVVVLVVFGAVGFGSQAVIALASRAAAEASSVEVRNGLVVRRRDPGAIRSVEVTRISSNWNLRRDVMRGGWQRLRLDVVGQDGDRFPVIASVRWVTGAGLPGEYKSFAASAGAPLVVRGQPDGA